jgi:MFS family permease
VVLFLLHGIVAGIAEPAERAAVAGLAPSRRGTAFGRYQALVGVGTLLGGIGLGWAYQTWTAPIAFPVAAGIGLIPLAGWLTTQRRLPA